jgi:hypothetical protein
MSRRIWLSLAMTWPLLLVTTGAKPGEKAKQEASAKKAQEWFEKAMEKLLLSKTAEWDTTLEVIKAPPPEEQEGRRYLFRVGTTKYHFRVKGNSRVAWTEKWDGKGQVPTREAWYEGFTWYLRSSDDAKKLTPIESIEGEGTWIKGRIGIGGALCWRLPHFFDAKNPKDCVFAYIEVYGDFKLIREEKLNDRAVVVLDYDISFGVAGHSAREPLGTTRVWIDREKLLFLQRETTLHSGSKKDPVAFQVRETYSEWKLDHAIANDLFHVEGMGPPDALVDASENPDEFEKEQTRKFLGFEVRDFPMPQGTTGFDELPKDASAFAFAVTPRKPPGGAKPLTWSSSGPSVSANGPDGKRIEAFCGHGNDETLAPGHPFQSTRENRRHDHGGGTYDASDLFIGKRLDGKLQPALFFRDLGSSANLHALALDGKGRCHLMVADVEFHRFKLLWLIGDLSTGKWLEAWCIAHHKGITSSSRPRSVTWGETIHLVWNWEQRFDVKEDDGDGVFHVAWTPAGFGPKTRLHKGAASELDMAVDPGTGRLLVVFGTKQGVLAASRPPKGPWTQPTPLPKDLAEAQGLAVQFADKEGFVIRTTGDEPKEWLLKAK